MDYLFPPGPVSWVFDFFAIYSLLTANRTLNPPTCPFMLYTTFTHSHLLPSELAARLSLRANIDIVIKAGDQSDTVPIWFLMCVSQRPNVRAQMYLCTFLWTTIPPTVLKPFFCYIVTDLITSGHFLSTPSNLVVPACDYKQGSAGRPIVWACPTLAIF